MYVRYNFFFFFYFPTTAKVLILTISHIIYNRTTRMTRCYNNGDNIETICRGMCRQKKNFKMKNNQITGLYITTTFRVRPVRRVNGFRYLGSV